MTSKLLAESTPNHPRVWWWDVCVPHFTWFVLGLFFLVPKAMRFVPFLLLFAPAAVGSLRNQWWIQVLRNLAKTKGFVVDKDAKMPDERPCILGIHPHGKCPMSILPTLETRSDLFENLVFAQSSLGKFVPTIGWTTAFSGNVIDVTRKQISVALSSGKHVGLMPGGAREMVHCQPFSETIPLVKHTGFLRLAHRLARGVDMGDHKTPCVVVPCFVFGLHDSFMNPLATLDAKLYESTGLNIPLWIPTSANKGTHTVIGEAIDPCDFETVDDFATAYFNALEALFETNKKNFSAYKGRTLEWIIPYESKKKNKPTRRSVSGFVFVTKFSVGFLVYFLVDTLLRGKPIRLSTSQLYELHHQPVLALHVVASLVWVLASGILTIKGFSPYHRVLGYIAVLALTTICGSAYHLTMTTWADSLNGGNLAKHIGFQSFVNMMIGFMSEIQLGFALAAAVAKESKMHSRTMGIIHKSMLLNFLPRLTAKVIRWLLPRVGGVEAYTLAALLQFCIPLWNFPRIKKSEIKRAVVPPFWMGILLAMVSLVGEWCTNFSWINLLSFLYPLTAFFAGAALFGLEKRHDYCPDGPIKKIA